MAHEPYFSLAIWHVSHTVMVIMKMTMHIDEEVLDRVMKVTGAKSKTAAVELALNEMARRHKMKELFSAGLGLSPDELKNAFDPKSHPDPVGSLAFVAESSDHGKSHPTG